MTRTYAINGMTCSGCADSIKAALSSVPHIKDVAINLSQSSAKITMDQNVPIEELKQSLKMYPSYQIAEEPMAHQTKRPAHFWDDPRVWSRASFNTLNCLIGCSIGDFGMIIYLQRFYPATSMLTQMVLATFAGLITSVLLETILLKKRESFHWDIAFKTALSMSFISMVAMELVMNTTDFMITGGKAAFGNPMYWTALAISMIAGFLAPLPYNYYKLKKYNQACH